MEFHLRHDTYIPAGIRWNAVGVLEPCSPCRFYALTASCELYYPTVTLTVLALAYQRIWQFVPVEYRFELPYLNRA